MDEFFREFTINVQGSAGVEPIAILQRSEGEHTFIAWHGISAVNRQWFWDVLWPHGSVYLAGLPGHGGLPVPSATHWQDWTPQHLIEVGIETVRTLGQGRPVTLLGHSTGGMIALGVAQQAPELVDRLILLAPVVWSDLTGIVGLWQRMAWNPEVLRLTVAASLGPGKLNKSIYWASLRAFIADREALYANERVAMAVYSGYEQVRQTPFRAVAGVTRVLCQADQRPTLRQAPPTMPTLLIHGEQDPIIPFSQAEWLANALPEITFVPVPHTGHLPYGERELFTNQTVEHWLQQHPIATDGSVLAH